MKAITTWFFTGGGSCGDVEGVYRCLTSLSPKSRTGPSSYKRTIMSVSYHMKLLNKFITTIRLSVITMRHFRVKNLCLCMVICGSWCSAVWHFFPLNECQHSE